jgi:methylmalonyl-CoA mutase N-terminal domain/subunit
VKPQREGLMAKVLQAVSGSTADRIAGEHDAIAGIERLIVELEQQQQTHLTDIDPSRALQNEAAIDANRRALAVRQARLAALQQQARREDIDRRQWQRKASIDGDIEPKLRKCVALTGDLIKALSAVDDVRRELREVGDSVSRD